MGYVFSENRTVLNNYHGVSVYATYRGNFEEQGENEFIFTTNPLGCEDDDDAFDIRNLETYDSKLSEARNLTIAIDSGLLNEDAADDYVRQMEGGCQDFRAAGDDDVRENICPVCGRSLVHNNSFTPMDDDSILSVRFECRNCGAQGKGCYSLEFEGFEID